MKRNKAQADTVLVLGYFDGLHRGHQELFRTARTMPMSKDSSSCFDLSRISKIGLCPLPTRILLHLQNPEERFKRMEELGVDDLYLIDFTSDFAAHTAQEFVAAYLTALRARVLVAGFDYSFGSDKKVACDLETYFKGQVIVVPPVLDQGENQLNPYSAGHCIWPGQRSADLLGYPLSSRGIVVHGDARGRTIGFPTANLAPIDRTHLPQDGVYVVEVEVLGQRHRGMASVGKTRPLMGRNFALKPISLIFQKIFMDIRFGFFG